MLTLIESQLGTDEVVINEGQVAMNFRVETNTEDDAIKVAGGANTVGFFSSILISPTTVAINSGAADINFQIGDDTSATAVQLDAEDREFKVYSTIIMNATGDLKLQGDSNKIHFGAVDDATIYWDGSSLILDPSVTGGNTVSIGTAANMRLRTAGFTAAIVSKTANYTATATDHTILCGAGNESFTISLPDVSSAVGTIYVIKNIGTGTITIDPFSTDTIDGAGTHEMTVQYNSVIIQTDGTDWFILGSRP